jgi:hypothetical protein
MATSVQLQTVDGPKYFKVEGAGSSGDPFRAYVYLDGTPTVQLSSLPDGNVGLLDGTGMAGGIEDAGHYYDSTLLFTPSSDLSAGGADITATPASGAYRQIDDLIISVAVTMLITIVEGVSPEETVMGIYLEGNSGAHQITPRANWKAQNPDVPFRAHSNASGGVAITTFSRDVA